MSARAGIVVTGTEVLSGRVTDRNGPWLAERLRALGVDAAYIAIVGDRAEDMRAALEFMAAQGMDLIVTSGGLGPTADDLTTEVVGGFQGREMVLDEPLSERIAAIVAPLMKRWPHIDPEAVAEANRKQATVPEGAEVLEPVGTAPGVVVVPEHAESPVVVVLPGPPRELQPMWGTAAGERRRARGAREGGRVPRGRRCGCSGSPSPRSRRRCGWPSATASSCPRSRSRPA